MKFLNTTFSSWKNLNESDYYHKDLNPLFWTKKGGEYQLDPIVCKKLIKIAKEFYGRCIEMVKNVDIIDIHLTGSLANYNYTKHSDLDVCVLIDFSKIRGFKEEIKSSLDEIRLTWDMLHDMKLRGHGVEIYIHDYKEPHTSTGLYSLLNREWIKTPKHSHPDFSDEDVEKKYTSISSEIEILEKKLLASERIPSNAKELYSLANKLRKKIEKMGKESLEVGGGVSVGELSFGKLKNLGYIGRLNDVISLSYGRIYNGKKI